MFFFFFNGEKVDALTLANYVLKRAEAVHTVVTNLKLQKILYYVQGHFLAEFNRPLFPDEIQAWKFGPVVPSVYYEFSMFGPDALVQTGRADMGACSEAEQAFIDQIIDEKLSMSAHQLVEATHAEEPWRRATENGTCIRANTVISIDSMRDYFRRVRV